MVVALEVSFALENYELVLGMRLVELDRVNIELVHKLYTDIYIAISVVSVIHLLLLVFVDVSNHSLVNGLEHVI